MRIVHAVQCGPTTGGTVSHVMTLAARQQARGLDVAVCAASDGLLAESCARLGIPVVIDPLLNARPDAPAAPAGYAQQVTRSLGLHKPTLIHAHLRFAGFAANVAASRLGVPMVYTQHMGDRDPLIALDSLQRAQMTIIAVSRAVLAHTTGYAANPDRIHLIPNGVDIPPVSGFRLPRTGRANILYCGRLVQEKGVDVAILALAVLRRQLAAGDVPHLHIAGIGPEEPLLRRLVAAADLSDLVTFHGSVPHAIHAEVGADLVVVPSRHEPCGLVVLEAMASRLPVVASRTGGIPEMVRDDVDGHLVQPDDPAALAAAIRLVLASDHSERVNVAQRRHADEFTADRMAARTIALYRAVLQKASRDARGLGPAAQIR